MNEIKVTVDNKAWIPHSPKLEARTRHTFEIRMYNEKICDRCEYRPERHCEICEECPSEAYLGKYKLWQKKDTDKGIKLGLPLGRPSLIRKVIGSKLKMRIRDKRPATAMRHRIKFTGELRDNQKQPVKDMIKARRGILQAPPRAGKTVMSIYIACKLGLKTLVLAKQYDWLQQFYETIYGSKHRDGSWKEKPQTNVADIEERKGRKIAGFCKTIEDIDKYDICLCTYQSFISDNGKKRLKKIKSKFGIVVIDECDNVPTDRYLAVVGELNSKYLVGLTGTPERKDMRHVLSDIVLGTVKARAKVKTMRPKLVLKNTGTNTSYNYKSWPAAINFLSRNKERNRLIVKEACKDIKAGRHIVIPVERNVHVKELVEAINKKMGKTVCQGFDGKVEKQLRDKHRDNAKLGKIKCIVGMRKMVQRGINVPIWDMMYVVMPISNPPNFEQETSRVRTVMEGKPQPVIKHFVEDFGITKGCFRTCYWQTYVPLGFEIDDKTKAEAKSFMGNKRRAQPETVIF